MLSKSKGEAISFTARTASTQLDKGCALNRKILNDGKGQHKLHIPVCFTYLSIILPNVAIGMLSHIILSRPKILIIMSSLCLKIAYL